jgi:hypothetical protein
MLYRIDELSDAKYTPTLTSGAIIFYFIKTGTDRPFNHSLISLPLQLCICIILNVNIINAA